MYTGVRAMMHDHAAHVLLLPWALVLGGCFSLHQGAFGVCSPNPNPPCEERNANRLLLECALDLRLLSGVWMPACACMRLAREPGGALPDRGEPVALQSCLAYREIYPDQVSCLDGEWNEL